MTKLIFCPDITWIVFNFTVSRVSSLLLADNEPPEVASQFKGLKVTFLGLGKFG